MEKEKIAAMSEEDILNALMGNVETPSTEFIINRLQIPIQLSGLTEKEISKLKVQCTYNGVLDSAEFDAAVIMKATSNFNWNNEKLLNMHKASSGKELIRKLLLAGEITSLVKEVLILSGFSNSIEKVEDTIKN